MIGSLDTSLLQMIWWGICATVGSLFLFLTFVQGGQTLLRQVGETEEEKSLIINSLGRKWELTFTTLVLFGGALFAAFPKFYSTSFGGAYWVWMLILFTFVIQAVSYEYRKKPSNLFGSTVYELFLFINGSVGILLIGAAIGTFFTGSDFRLTEYNEVIWGSGLRGLGAALFLRAGTIFNICFGLFLVFNARTLGAMYLVNNINFSANKELEERLRHQCLVNFLLSLPFLLYILAGLLLMDGFGVEADGTVTMVANKYLANLLAMPWVLGMLVGGLLLVIIGVTRTGYGSGTSGIWFGGLGTVLVGLAVLFTAAFNGTAFYPSFSDLQSSLTIQNASSSHYTLTVMSYVALVIPFVLAYIVIVWYKMDIIKLGHDDLDGHHSY